MGIVENLSLWRACEHFQHLIASSNTLMYIGIVMIWIYLDLHMYMYVFVNYCVLKHMVVEIVF